MAEVNANALRPRVFDPERAGALMSEWLTHQKAAFDALSAKFSKPEIGAEPAELWRSYMETHYYTTASRYTTSAFLRLKLGEALSRRRVAAHIFETAQEAHSFVEDQEHDGKTVR